MQHHQAIAVNMTKGLHLCGVVVNLKHLGSGLKLRDMDTAHSCGNKEQRHIIWQAPSMPTYHILEFKMFSGEYVVKGDLFVTVRKKEELALIDVNGKVYSDMVPDENRRLSPREHKLCSARFAHMDDWKHVVFNLFVAVENREALEEATIRWGALMMCMYELEKIDENVKPYHRCAGCRLISTTPLKKCPCRRGVRYCSAECQLADWRRGHKDVCVAME